jgi:methylmalonyl-CoA/ethylmalonyl-CoA epimerase
MTSSDFRLSKIRQISLPAYDQDRAVAFYRDKLGMKHQFSVPNLAFFDCDGLTLMLGKPETAEFDHPGSTLYFDVADIQAAYQTLVERGVEFIDKPQVIAELETHVVWMTFFRDTEGNILSLMSYVAR